MTPEHPDRLKEIKSDGIGRYQEKEVDGWFDGKGQWHPEKWKQKVYLDLEYK